MKHHLLAIILFLIGIHQLKSQNENGIVIGSKHIIQSTLLNEEREYWVNLPESYHKAELSYKKYPILMILDGNAHFKSISGMVNYMSTGYNGNLKIPEMIVVAIQNVNRLRDFTPDKVVTIRKNDSGGGEQFLSFLENELIPELERNYRTEPYRILFGHSLGGLLAVHTFLKAQTNFNAFIAVDPSFGTWDAETMDSKLESVTDNSFRRFLYIATANWGRRNIRNRDRHIRFYEALHSKSKNEFNAKLEYFENENHGSVPPIAFYNGISAIFDGYGINYQSIETTEQLSKHFQKLSQRLSWDMKPPEELVNRVAYRMLQGNSQGEKVKALTFFELNTRNYPESYNAFDSLGEAFETLGNNEKAIENYKKSLELNSNNANANHKIKSLSKVD
ncbi:alpha/beta hydrolase-fold protein [Aegicerativicinus sediminis]|uniref:alpha/beta hydrolase-fold protein n=1 Tax=Aegicerativicinus sediminis TaxID=2893202 RepID=UPI001E5860B3|nr:alpha/beta hydrolase-fold protein [Aegicerativicinus sediminis]